LNFSASFGFAQICDPTIPPSGLVSNYILGTGATLTWDVVPGSIGMQIKVTIPGGFNIKKRLVGHELTSFFVPDEALVSGSYFWRVQSACSVEEPHLISPISSFDSFYVGIENFCSDPIVDIDGNFYNTIQVGSQCWMKENLKVERYRNGSPIQIGLSTDDWVSTVFGAYTYYNYLPFNKDIYGVIYNMYTVLDTQGLCPVGWQVPSDADWVELLDFLGGYVVAGGSLKTTGTVESGTGLWLAPNVAATNSSGFSGLPGGLISGLSSTFWDLSEDSNWWSSTEYSFYSGFGRNLDYSTSIAGRFLAVKQTGFYVRCLREE